VKAVCRIVSLAVAILLMFQSLSLAERSIRLEQSPSSVPKTETVTLPDLEGTSNYEAGEALFARGFYQESAARYFLALDDHRDQLEKPYLTLGTSGRTAAKVASSLLMGTFTLLIVNSPSAYGMTYGGKMKNESDALNDKGFYVINTPLHIYKRLIQASFKSGNLVQAEKYISEGMSYALQIKQATKSSPGLNLADTQKASSIVSLEATLYEIEYLSAQADIRSLCGKYLDSLGKVRQLNRKIAELQTAAEEQAVLKAKVAMLVARLLTETGDFQKALALYDFALKNLDHPSGEFSFNYAKDAKYSFKVPLVEDLVTAYQGKASILHRLGQTQKAIETCNRCFDYFSTSALKNHFSPEYIEYLLNPIRLEKTRFYVFLRQWELAKEQLSPLISGNQDLFLGAESNLLLSEIHVQTGEVAAGKQATEKGIAMAKAIDADTLQRKGLLMLATLMLSDEPDKAIETLEKVQKLEKKMGIMRPDVKLLQIEAYLSVGNIKKTRHLLGEVQKELPQYNDPHLHQAFYHLKAKSLYNMQQPKNAVENYKKAISYLEKLRGEIGVDNFKTTYFANKTVLYNEMIDILIELGNIETALQFLEKTKGRTMVDLLSQGRYKASTAQNALYQELKSNEVLLTANLQKQTRLSELNEGQRSVQNDLTGELRSLEDKNRSIRLKIQERDRYFSSVVLGETTGYQKLKKTLDSKTLLVEYYLGEKKSGAFLVSRKALKYVPLSIKLKDRVHALLENHGLSDRERYRNLGKLLIAPLQDKFTAFKQIGFIPSGPLNNVSFVALDYMGKPLIDNKSVFVVPSASIYEMVSQKPFKPSGKALVFSDPHYDDQVLGLPNAQKEGQMIAKIFNQATLYDKKAATEDAFKQQNGPYDFYHFATHGFFNENNPMLSYISLRDSSEDDGKLFANEIIGHDLSSDLVVISTCQSGQVKVIGGDEIMGLNRSFLIAGTKTLISTLWNIDDAATYTMMKEFYRRYHPGGNKAETFRTALLKMKTEFPDYRYWAAFQLSGSIH